MAIFSIAVNLNHYFLRANETDAFSGVIQLADSRFIHFDLRGLRSPVSHRVNTRDHLGTGFK